MAKYVVRFNYSDINGDPQKCEKYFYSKIDAERFAKHITEETRQLVKVYGLYGCYNPYKNIRIEEVNDDRKR